MAEGYQLQEKQATKHIDSKTSTPAKLALETPLGATLAAPLKAIQQRIADYDGQRTWAGGAVIRTSVTTTADDTVHFSVRMGGETGSIGWIIGEVSATGDETTQVSGRYGIEPHLNQSLFLALGLPIVAGIGAGTTAFLIGLLLAVLMIVGMVIAVVALNNRVQRHAHILFDIPSESA